jgi:hypothetical protein
VPPARARQRRTGRAALTFSVIRKQQDPDAAGAAGSTRDTIDLSRIFTAGTASEEDVIVGGE